LNKRAQLVCKRLRFVGQQLGVGCHDFFLSAAIHELFFFACEAREKKIFQKLTSHPYLKRQMVRSSALSAFSSKVNPVTFPF